MRALWLILPLAYATTACMDTHSVPPPKKPNAEAKIDVGPIVDESGVDVGPVVAARIHERGLGDAHYVSGPGENPYFSGKLRVEKGESGVSGAATGAVTLLAIGIPTAVVGGVLFGIGSASRGGESIEGIGTGLTVLGAVLIGGSIALFFQPSRYREGTVVADLEVKRGTTTTPFAAKDDALIHHDVHKDEQAGEPILDGVVNAIGKETSR